MARRTGDIDGLAIVDDAVAEPRSLARALRGLLGPHPIPQSDPRTRGQVVTLDPAPTHAEQLQAVPEPLRGLFARFCKNPAASYILAVNETPPGEPDQFLMRPHLDRVGPSRILPQTTTVVFLDFPKGAPGGQLVVFPREAAARCGGVLRANARQTAADLGGILIDPIPGRATTLSGDLPHAVISYASESECWRQVAVLSEFPGGSILDGQAIV